MDLYFKSVGGNTSGSWHELTPHYVVFVCRPAPSWPTHIADEAFAAGIFSYYSSKYPYLIFLFRHRNKLPLINYLTKFNLEFFYLFILN